MLSVCSFECIASPSSIVARLSLLTILFRPFSGSPHSPETRPLRLCIEGLLDGILPGLHESLPLEGPIRAESGRAKFSGHIEPTFPKSPLGFGPLLDHFLT